MKWICSQIGAREHYAVPRVLHRGGKLECLYTDLWTDGYWRRIADLIGRSNLAARYHEDLDDAKIESFNLATIVDLSFGCPRNGNLYDWFLLLGSDFGRSVESSLKRKKRIIWPETIFFGYDTGFFEPARWVKAMGGKTIVCQMDPSRTEAKMVKEEESLWPGWAKFPLKTSEAFFRRREQEWSVADLVIVNSEWTRQALIEQEVPTGKIFLIPLAYETGGGRGRPEVEIDRRGQADSMYHPESRRSAPLKVLFLGQVILRKGIQYLIEAANMLRNEAVHFDVVGPIGISESGIKSAPPGMTFHGPVSHNVATEFFRNADLFVLPTISDGFALTQIEAMTYGLPVIATPNCGKVVTDGVDGMIVAERSSRSLADAISLLAANPEKLRSMGLAASRKISYFDFSRLGENLRLIEEMLMSSR